METITTLESLSFVSIISNYIIILALSYVIKSKSYLGSTIYYTYLISIGVISGLLFYYNHYWILIIISSASIIANVFSFIAYRKSGVI